MKGSSEDQSSLNRDTWDPETPLSSDSSWFFRFPLVQQAPESPGRPGLPGHPSSPGPAATCLPPWRGRRFTRPTVSPGSEDHTHSIQDVEQPGHLEPRDFSRFRSLLVHQISLGSSGPRITRAIRFTGPPKLTRPSSFIRPKDHQTTKVHCSPTTEEENTSHMG